MNDRPAILVTDGEQRSALAVTRSLGAAGYRVIVGHSRPGALSTASRHAWRSVRLPAPEQDAAAWLGATERVVREQGVRAIVPVTETTMLALLPHDPITDVVIAGPVYEAFEAIRDKQALLDRATTLGIAVPAQHALSPDEDPPADLVFPVVVKPARSVFDDGGRRFKTTVQYARDRAHLSTVLQGIPPGAFPVLLQEHVRGPGIGVFGLRWGGCRLATFAHRRIREKPPSGGVSVCSESVHASPDLIAASWRLIESYDWRGVAMVEYKHDDATGRNVLMEVNGRFWGSLQLAIHAGVDFPRLLVDAALGETVEPVADYRTGVRNHWEWGEIDAALLRRNSDPLTGRRGSVFGSFRDVARLLPRRDRAEVFRLTDPLPFWRETVAWLKRH